MKQEDVFNKIGIIIKELAEQYEYLEIQQGQLGDLDLEIFIANAHFLADNAAVLRKLNARPVPAKPEVSRVEEKYFEPLARQPQSVTLPVSKPEPIKQVEPVENKPVPTINLSAEAHADDYSYIRQEPDAVRHELVVDESWYDDEEEELVKPPEIKPATAKPAENISPKPVEPAPKMPSPVVFDGSTAKKDDGVLTINEMIAAQLSNKPTPETTGQQITDLKAAITLNEKLRFIKDLFNGYSLAYSEAIEILNRFKKFEDAEQFLKANYIAKNNWEGKPETTEMFYALLKRRYL